MCKFIRITQITSKSQYPSHLPSQQKWHTAIKWQLKKKIARDM